MKPEITESEVRIYFSKFWNYFEFFKYLLILISGLIVLYEALIIRKMEKGTLFYVFCLAILLFLCYILFWKIKDILNINAQIIIGVKGIELVKKGKYDWAEISKIEAWIRSGKYATSFLDLTLLNSKQVSIEIDDLDVKVEDLNKWISKYRTLQKSQFRGIQ